MATAARVIPPVVRRSSNLSEVGSVLLAAGSAGQNACKGLGFVELPKSNCDAAQGKIKHPEKKPA